MPFKAWLKWAENHWNHPYWHYREDYGNWAPLSQRVCNFFDWLLGPDCHD
jgi:hypothetical protein